MSVIYVLNILSVGKIGLVDRLTAACICVASSIPVLVLYAIYPAREISPSIVILAGNAPVIAGIIIGFMLPSRRR